MHSERHAVPLRSRAAAWLYAMTGIISLVLGSIYFFRPTFMPYHAVALGKSWEQLDHATQTLIKALMEVVGGGWLAVGALVLALVAFPIRRGDRWARFTAPAALLLCYVPALLATLSVLRETPASPPWLGTAVLCVAAVLGFLLDAPWRSVGRGDDTPSAGNG